MPGRLLPHSRYKKRSFPRKIQPINKALYGGRIVDLSIAAHKGHQKNCYGNATLSKLIDSAKPHLQIEKSVLHVR